MSLDMKNPIEIDYTQFCYVWKSDCKNVSVRLHFNRKIFTVDYPVRCPTAENDEYEQKCEINTYSRFKQNQRPNSKYIFKFSRNQQEFSVNHLASIWEELYLKMIELVDAMNKQNEGCNKLSIIDDNADSKKLEISVKLPEAMPLSCSSTHLHRFDNIEAASEPKIIYKDKTWYK